MAPALNGANIVRQPPVQSKKNKVLQESKSSRRPSARSSDTLHILPNEPTRRQEPHGQRHPQELRYSDVPDYPPPSFQEAMSSHPSMMYPSTLTLQNRVPSGVFADSDSDESDLEIVEEQDDHSHLETHSHDRGRAPFLHEPSVPKRRHMSLSPLRTLFPQKPIALQNRALSAQSTSPYSFPRNTSLFKSTTSLRTLSTGSFFRLPLSAPSSTSLVRPESKGSSKGKGRLIEPLESWEVVDEPGGYGSIMSVIDSLSRASSPDPSPTQDRFAHYSSCSYAELSTNQPLTQNSVSLSRPSNTGSFRATCEIPSSAEVESRKSQPLPSFSTQTSSPSGVSSGARLPAASSSSPYELAPSSLPKKLATSPLSVQSWKADSAEDSTLLQLAVETPLPLTPVENELRMHELNVDLSGSCSHARTIHHQKLNVLTEDTAHDAEISSFSDDIEDEGTRNGLSRVMPTGESVSHSPRILGGVLHKTNDTPVSSEQSQAPSPLQLSFPPLSTLSSSSSSASTFTPALHRRHYPGRPLPKTPEPAPSPYASEITRYAVDSLYAPHPNALLQTDSPSQVCPEGLLIDFADPTPAQSFGRNSPTSTVRGSAYTVKAQSIGNGKEAEKEMVGTVDNADFGPSTGKEASLVDAVTAGMGGLSGTDATTRPRPNLTDMSLSKSPLEESKQRNLSNAQILDTLSQPSKRKSLKLALPHGIDKATESLSQDPLFLNRKLGTNLKRTSRARNL